MTTNGDVVAEDDVLFFLNSSGVILFIKCGIPTLNEPSPTTTSHFLTVSLLYIFTPTFMARLSLQNSIVYRSPELKKSQ